MTEVITDRKIFEYDVHSLVKAFYPKEEVTVSFAEEIPESFSGYGIAYGDNCPIKVSYYRDGTALKTILSEETKEAIRYAVFRIDDVVWLRKIIVDLREQIENMKRGDPE